jgi:DNA repair protein RadC
MEAPHYHGHRQRLRERFLKSGFAGFAEHEIVELLLTLCIPRRDVKATAKALLERFGCLRAILDAPISDLQQTPGIGEVAPVALRVIREAASLYLQQRAEEATVLASPESLKSFWRSRLGGLRNEVFEVAYLDSASRLMRNGVETLEEGTVDRAAVYPRRVAEAALRRGAAAIVVAHNHPNGNVTPSEHDKVLTRALVLAATTLQIKVIDHLVVSADAAFSFREAGLL